MEEALQALERLGAKWNARRVSKKFLLDTVECSTLVQTSDGVIRGMVEVQRWDGYCRTKAEVSCYIEGRLKADGTFKHVAHSKDKTVKIFEYENEVLCQCSKVFGVALGWRPVDDVPIMHQFLTDFSEQLVGKADSAKRVVEKGQTTADDERRCENEARARRALFG